MKGIESKLGNTVMLPRNSAVPSQLEPTFSSSFKNKEGEKENDTVELGKNIYLSDIIEIYEILSSVE